MNGFQIVAEVRHKGKNEDGGTAAHFYELHAPQVSADGTVFAYTGERPTFTCRGCQPVEPNRAVILRGEEKITMDGNVALTGGGRYAITTPVAATLNGFHIVTDLESGTSTVAGEAFNGSFKRLTDDGTVLTPEPTAIILTDRNGFTRVLQTKRYVSDAVMSQSASRSWLGSRY